MRRVRDGITHRALLQALLLAIATVAAPVERSQAAPPHGDAIYKPQIAQPGKDVIWVPSSDDIVARMLVMAQTRPTDYVVDLGAGDGKIAIMAAKRFGARALGVEYNADLVGLAERNAAREGVTERVAFRHADIFETDFSQATVVTLFLGPLLNLKLRPHLLSMRPGTRIVSHAFDMDDWRPDEVTRMEGYVAYLWIIPARMQGSWRLHYPVAGRNRDIELDFMQIYQRIEGEATLTRMRTSLRDTLLSGNDIRFSLLDEEGRLFAFSGRVAGDVMEGTVTAEDGASHRWRASRR